MSPRDHSHSNINWNGLGEITIPKLIKRSPYSLPKMRSLYYQR
ncbi:MAG: hypothetical protein ACRC6M_11195 [Microcystaceae cyanobacterium]